MKDKREEAVISVKIDDIDVDNGSYLTFETELAAFFPDGEKAESDSAIEIAVTLRMVGNTVYVIGEAKGEVKLQCGRCLAEYRHRLDAELNMSFMEKEETEEEDEDSEELYTYDGESLDLYPHVRDQLLLLMPIKPLCKEECKGLCPKCGQDLNANECGCQRAEVDGRFSVLAKLKKSL